LASQQTEQTSVHFQQNQSGVTTSTSLICYLGLVKFPQPTVFFPAKAKELHDKMFEKQRHGF
jgi:hypothetical protein